MAKACTFCHLQNAYVCNDDHCGACEVGTEEGLEERLREEEDDERTGLFLH